MWKQDPFFCAFSYLPRRDLTRKQNGQLQSSYPKRQNSENWEQSESWKDVEASAYTTLNCSVLEAPRELAWRVIFLVVPLGVHSIFSPLLPWAALDRNQERRKVKRPNTSESVKRALEGASSARAAVLRQRSSIPLAFLERNRALLLLLLLFYKYLRDHIIFCFVCALAQGGVHGGQMLTWTSSLIALVLVNFLLAVTKHLTIAN